MSTRDDKVVTPHFRARPRKRKELKVRLAAAEGATEGWATTRDVGPGGAYLQSDVVLQIGTRLTLDIEASDGEGPISVEAEVRWCTPEDAEERGMGVRFVAPSSEVLMRLGRLPSDSALPVLEIYDEESD